MTLHKLSRDSDWSPITIRVGERQGGENLMIYGKKERGRLSARLSLRERKVDTRKECWFE